MVVSLAFTLNRIRFWSTRVGLLLYPLVAATDRAYQSQYRDCREIQVSDKLFVFSSVSPVLFCSVVMFCSVLNRTEHHRLVLVCVITAIVVEVWPARILVGTRVLSPRVLCLKHHLREYSAIVFRA